MKKFSLMRKLSYSILTGILSTSLSLMPIQSPMAAEGGYDVVEPECCCESCEDGCSVSLCWVLVGTALIGGALGALTSCCRSSKGSHGHAGVRGPEGLAGPQGLEGLNGVQGNVGPIGTQGAVGPIGSQGPTGQNGVQGTQGPAGQQGSQGVQGSNGLNGEAGLPGLNGVQGNVGPTGTQGLTGASGPQGNPGLVGPQGPQGLAGAAGPAGVQGPQGLPGVQGSQGPAGPQGPTGVEGPQGPAGPSCCCSNDGGGTTPILTPSADTVTFEFINDADGDNPVFSGFVVGPDDVVQNTGPISNGSSVTITYTPGGSPTAYQGSYSFGGVLDSIDAGGSTTGFHILVTSGITGQNFNFTYASPFDDGDIGAQRDGFIYIQYQ